MPFHYPAPLCQAVSRQHFTPAHGLRFLTITGFPCPNPLTLLSHFGNPSQTFSLDITDSLLHSRYPGTGSVHRTAPPRAPFSFGLLKTNRFTRYLELCAPPAPPMTKSSLVIS